MDDKDREIQELKARLDAVEAKPAPAPAPARSSGGGCGTVLAVGFACFVALYFCGSLRPDDPKMSNGKDEIENRVAAEIAVERQLRDPKSAQYGTVTVRDFGNGDVIVCGQVNGKNAFGGYVGERPFVYAGGRVTLIDINAVSAADAALFARCVN